MNSSNDAVRRSGRVVHVGDSDIRRASARAIAGSASGGRGAGAAKRLRVRRVEVAVRRLGKGCRWLSSARVRFRSVGGDCDRPARWLRASGRGSWRLELARSLPPGRYVAYSRVRNRAGFREARFSAADRNRVAFTVR